MIFTRRKFVLMGLSALAVGCSQRTGGLSDRGRPGPAWPTPTVRPQPAATGTYLPPKPAPTAAAPAATPPATASGLTLIPRQSWTTHKPVAQRLNPLNGARRITVHHEGHLVVDFHDTTATAHRLQLIQRAHVVDRGWGDIGYHYVIDRAGRVWEGRPLNYQGAHVSQHNEHNLGVMVLGNFDRQSPTEAQIASLRNTLLHLRAAHRIPTNEIYTHKEINPTACPGTYLQARMVTLRNGGYLG